jgi:DnaD/phage-associated family protein
MRKFNGFKPGKTRQIKLPATFFSELLPMIDDVAELKVILFCFWALYQKEGDFRYLRRRDFVNHTPLMDGLAAVAPAVDPEIVLEKALGRSIEREAILCAEVWLNGHSERFYFLNTELGRKAVSNVRAGAWKPGDADNPIEILPERPTIFQLYEDNIGTVPPMLREKLKDAEDEYPPAWIEAAFQEAVERNGRSWAYIEAILERWSREGKQRGADAKHPEQGGQKYISGEFAAYIKYKPDQPEP